MQSKGNHKQNEETTHRMGENIYKWSDRQNILTAHAAQCQKKINNPIKKWVEDLNRHFSKEDIQRAYKQINRCSTSYVIRKIKIKTTRKYHYKPITMCKIQNTDDLNCWRGCETTETLIHCWWECKVAQATLENSLAGLVKLNTIQ